MPSESYEPIPSRWARPALLLALAVGATLRALVFARNDSLWGDEAMLAANVCHRTVGELAGPLDYNQGAPYGFLALSRALVEAFGPSEWVLRLPALAAGLAALPLAALLAWRLLSPWGAAIAAGLFAFSPHAVAYAAEFKQYEVDLAVAAGLTLLTLRCLGDSGARKPAVRDGAESSPAQRFRAVADGGLSPEGSRTLDTLALALAGALAVWFSHPAAFVLGGAGLALVCAQPRRLGRLAGVGACWAASFAACFALILKPLAGNGYLADYWAGAFWPLPPRDLGDLAWLAHHAIAAFDLPGGFATAGFGSAGLAAFAALLGAGRLARSSRPALVLLVAPVGLALLASALGKYPFAGRFLFFALPATCVLVAAGLGEAAKRLGAGVAVALGVILAAPLLGECRSQLRQSSHAEAVRPVLARLAHDAVPGETLLANAKALPALGYYLPRTPALPQSAITLAESPSGLARQVAALPGGPVLVVLAHATPPEVAAVRALLAMRCGFAPPEAAAPGVVAVRAVLPGGGASNPVQPAGFRLSGP